MAKKKIIETHSLNKAHLRCGSLLDTSLLNPNCKMFRRCKEITETINVLLKSIYDITYLDS